MKIALILGSIRNGRQSNKVAEYLNNKFILKGIDATLIDLKDYPLPLLTDKSGETEDESILIKEVSSLLSQADAFIFISPECHGSYSGVLKNALDYFWAEFNRKPIGVATVSAGKMGGINASTQLQQLILSLGAFPIPIKLLVPDIYHVFDDNGQISHGAFDDQVEAFINEFIWFSEAIVDKKLINA